MATWNGKIHPAAELFPMMTGDEFGSLVESIKSQGLREAAWLTTDGDLLDGRNRVAACEKAGVQPTFRVYDGDDPVSFVVALNLDRRHLTAGQRAMLALKLVPMYEAEGVAAKSAGGLEAGRGRPKGKVGADLPQPIERGPRARDKAGVAAKVSGRAVAQAKRVSEHDAELAAKVESGEIALDRADRIVKDRKRTEKREEEAKQRATIVKTGTRMDLRTGDFRKVMADLQDVDAIITDPPYPKEHLPLLDDLAAFAETVLKPDGLLAVMMGQSYLPEVYRRLDGRLPYLWTIAYLTPGGQAVQVWDRKVNTFWKPILIYGKTADWFGDVAKSDTNDNDKRHHEWGQSTSGMVDLIQRLVKPGAHIVDPFLGAGTTAIAARATGCHFTGCDIDEAHVERSRQRLADAA